MAQAKLVLKIETEGQPLTLEIGCLEQWQANDFLARMQTDVERQGGQIRYESWPDHPDDLYRPCVVTKEGKTRVTIRYQRDHRQPQLEDSSGGT